MLYLIAAGLMTALASGLDGVSVWEILNKRQNAGLHMAAAEQGALEDQLSSKEKRAEALRAEIALLVEQATNMDNDGDASNDNLIPGKLAMIESRKADLANLDADVDAARMAVVAASTMTAQADTGRHVLLQMADQHENPAQWLVTRAAIIFAIPELTLALLAWSLRPAGGERRRYLEPVLQGEEGQPAFAHGPVAFAHGQAAFAHGPDVQGHVLPEGYGYFQNGFGRHVPVAYAIHPQSGLPVALPVQQSAPVPFTPSRKQEAAGKVETTVKFPFAEPMRATADAAQGSEASSPVGAPVSREPQSPVAMSRDAAGTESDEIEPLADRMDEGPGEEWPEPLQHRMNQGTQLETAGTDRGLRNSENWKKRTPTDQAREKARQRELGQGDRSIRRAERMMHQRPPGAAKDRRKRDRESRRGNEVEGVSLPS